MLIYFKERFNLIFKFIFRNKSETNKPSNTSHAQNYRFILPRTPLQQLHINYASSILPHTPTPTITPCINHITSYTTSTITNPSCVNN